MPSAKSDVRIKAEQIYRENNGMIKLVEIANQLGIQPSKVRKWKSIDGWDKKDTLPEKTKNKQVERSTCSKWNDPSSNVSKRKRGGQPGNSNGKGGPVGNIKSATHGAYIKFYESALTSEELEAYQQLANQKERVRLQTLYAQHQITERKLMKDIAAINNGSEMITHKTVSQIEPSGKKTPEGKEITKILKINQEQISRNNLIRNFTDALTRVRAEMRRTVDSIRQLSKIEEASNNTEYADSNFVDALTCIAPDIWQDEKDKENNNEL